MRKVKRTYIPPLFSRGQPWELVCYLLYLTTAQSPQAMTGGQPWSCWGADAACRICMRPVGSDYGGYEHTHQPSHKNTKFSDNMSKEAEQGHPSQSNFSADILGQARGWKQLDDFKCSLPHSHLGKHRAPSSSLKGCPATPVPVEPSQTEKIYVSISHRPGPHFCSGYRFLLACSILCNHFINCQRKSNIQSTVKLLLQWFLILQEWMTGGNGDALITAVSCTFCTSVQVTGTSIRLGQIKTLLSVKSLPEKLDMYISKGNSKPLE